MSAPKRIQRQRTKGWRMPEDAIYVGRPTFWGNPYQVGDSRMPFLAKGTTLTTVQETVDCYRDLVCGGGPNLVESEWHASRVGLAIEQLRGHDLACWCPLSSPCHADVLLELANGGAR